MAQPRGASCRAASSERGASNVRKLSGTAYSRHWLGRILSEQILGHPGPALRSLQG